MNAGKLRRFREQLQQLRERLQNEVKNVAEALQEEINVDANLSAAPVHFADVAPSAVDARVEVLQAERSLLDQIQAALERIAQGTFGVCTACHSPIALERLQAIPYTSLCVTCSRTHGPES